MPTFYGPCGHGTVDPETRTMDDGDTLLFRCPTCGVWMEPMPLRPTLGNGPAVPVGVGSHASTHAYTPLMVQGYQGPCMVCLQPFAAHGRTAVAP